MARKWVRLVAGIILGTSASAAQAYYPEPEPILDPPPMGRPSQAHEVLNRAIENHRRGDYEAAAPLFREAELRSGDLTPTERQELARFKLDNREALIARQVGTEQLRMAERATQEGRQAAAMERLKVVAANEQYLTPADRARFEQLQGQNRPHAPSGAVVDNSLPARAKVQQARVQLGLHDLDAAERLAHEAERMGVTFTPSEDSPQRVLADVATAMNDAKVLLVAARISQKRGELDRADFFARLAEKKSGTFTFTWSSDTPAKAIKDIENARARVTAEQPAATTGAADAKLEKPQAQTAEAVEAIRSLLIESRRELDAENFKQARKLAEQARSRSLALGLGVERADKLLADIARAEAGAPAVVRTPATPATQPVALAAPGSRPASAEAVESVRTLLAEAQREMQHGDLRRARKLAEQARSVCQLLGLPQDNAESLLADIAGADPTAPMTARSPLSTTGSEAKVPVPVPTPIATAPVVALPKVTTKQEAVALLREGRAKLEAGKVAEAIAIAVHLKAADQIGWHLFEDTPAKLQEAAEDVQHKRNQEEATKVLAKGRELFEKGDYDGAMKAAYTAQNLHGSYGFWNVGDRPSKLLADVEAARERDRKLKIEGPAQRTNAATAEADARKLLAEARAALNNKDIAKARQLADRVSAMNVTLSKPGDDSVLAIRRDIEAVAATMPKPSVDPPTTFATDVPRPPVIPATTAATTPAPGDMAKVRACQMLAEARKLQVEGKYIEALQKVTLAQKTGARFGPDEDSPDLAAQQLAVLARQRVEKLLRAADETMNYAGNDPAMRDPAARYQKADENLGEAVRLTTAFRLDGDGVGSRLERLRNLRNATMTAKAPLVAPPVPAANPGQAMLQEAARKLNEGDTVTARRLAQDVLAGPYGLQAGAQEILRKVETEENNQKLIAAHNAPKSHGRELLDKARLELNCGKLNEARSLAEEAFRGNYGVKDEAQLVLHDIDAEETGQQILEEQRNFDAAVREFNAGRYKQSNELLSHVDYHHLDPDRQTKYRELVQTAQMTPGSPDLVKTVAVVPIGLPTTDTPKPYTTPGIAIASDSTPAKARATDGIGASVVNTQAAYNEIKFQKLRSLGLDAQQEAAEKFKAGKTDAALATLQSYLDMVSGEPLSTMQVSALKRPIVSRMDQYKLMKATKDGETYITSMQDQLIKDHNSKELMEQSKQKKVGELIKRYNALMRQNKLDEALAVAEQAVELDPDNYIALEAKEIAERKIGVKTVADLKKQKNKEFDDGLDDVERTPAGEITAISHGVGYDRRAWENIAKRTSPAFTIPRRDVADRELERSLEKPASLQFQSMSLRQVIDDLRQIYGLNIVVDKEALVEKGIGLERPVDFKLDGVKLKHGLSMMLRDVGLTYIIDLGCVQITTPEKAKGKQTLATHYVADLVIPVGDFAKLPWANQGVTLPPPNVMMPQTPTYTPPTPLQTPLSMQNGSPIGVPTPNGTMSYSQPATGDSNNANNNEWKRSAPTSTQERELMRLITNVVSPQSWTEMGGPGTIDYHPLTMSLVVNQTQDIQEQIADLLAALRRLQDQEVAVEVRFISIADDFYEHIGVNFSASILTNNGKFGPQLETGQFQPVGQPNVFTPNGLIAGATQAGTLTTDLAIPITNNTFFQTLPQFGGYPGIGVGGLTMGLAFLNDIQVFLFMEAVQGDTRTHITQAPKLTLFNGQTATLSVNTNENFLTNISLTILGTGNPAFVPFIQTIPVGVNLTIQAVITADRRFVRMSINPTLITNVPGPVQTIPIILPIFPPNGIQDDRSSPITLTQLIQTPLTQSISVATTVSVPDGGTVLLGGLKRLSEQRTEFGPPIISKIPIINRLFKNTGYGRETESLLLMVTPRIIIQEEEEERQTGYRPPENTNQP